VLDASVALRWVFQNPESDYANRVKEQLLSDYRALIPSLWILEVANGLLVAERRGVLTHTKFEHALLHLETVILHADLDDRKVDIRQRIAAARLYSVTSYALFTSKPPAHMASR
jgi:predicted nucleic acid-binding protein